MKKRATILLVWMTCAVLLLCSCGKGNALTIETLLELETKSAVIERLGEPYLSDTYDFYSVSLMDKDWKMMVDYRDDAVDEIALNYYLPGMETESVFDMLSYTPKAEDIVQAEIVLDHVITDLTEKYGSPHIFRSPVNTTTYTWNCGEQTVEVQDNIENEQLWVFGAIEIYLEF